MKPLLSLIALSLSLHSANAQYFSENGAWAAPHDTIRVFLVFAEALGDTDYYEFEDLSNWPVGQMPTQPDKYFDATFNPSSVQGYMTRYFYEASFGRFVVLGDYYDTLVQIPFTDLSNGSNNLNKITAYLDSRPGNNIETASGYSINGTDFDKWSNYGSGTPKSYTGDSKVDIVMVIWRVNSKHTPVRASL